MFITLLNLDSAERIEREEVKKMYAVEKMLELSTIPMTQIEPDYLTNFEQLRITRSNVQVPANTREMVSDFKYFGFITSSPT